MEQPKINRADIQIALEAAFKAAEGLDRRTMDRVSNVVEQLLTERLYSRVEKAEAPKSYEIPKTAAEKHDEKTEAFSNEVRKLWADTFTAYTRSGNAVAKTGAKNWADEAVEEYKKRFTPKLF